MSSVIDASTPIAGPVDTTAAEIVAAIERRGGDRVAYSHDEVLEIAEAIIDLSELYGLRPSLIAAQIIIETGGFTYGNQVDSGQYNFAGIGATDDGAAGHAFASIEDGVEAVLQHHYAYLGKALPEGATLLDPRFHLVSKHVETIGEYGNGVWATDPGYAAKIVNLANTLTEDAMGLLDTIGQRLTDYGLEVHDLRGSLARGGPYPRIRPAAQTYTAVHYTAATRLDSSLNYDTLSWQGHASHHVHTNGWPGIAYCIGVSLSGRVFLLHEVEEMGYHAFDANACTFPVSVDMGVQEPTLAALSSLEAVLSVLHNDTPELPGLTYASTYGHRELTFLDKRNITVCPGSLLPAIQRYRGGGDFDGQTEPSTSVTFPTGITMNTTYAFYQYWEVNGGVEVFGYPISDEMDEGGMTVQYFERARLEFQAEGSITRGLVGSEVYASRYGST